jgi:uncharacterized SAM-binding protein YcdF (DUF218 family)
MFGRKYVFESKKTRFNRLLLNSIVLFVFVLISYTLFLIYIPISGKIHKERSDKHFFAKSPDAIVVFTGDKGRLKYTFDLVQKYPEAKLMISGVYEGNSLKTLLLNQAEADALQLNLEAQNVQVDMDYESKNTNDNVRETLQYIKADSKIKKVLVVSSDYHIMRINLMFNNISSSNHELDIFYDSVPTDYSDWNNTKKLLKESVKIIRTFILVKIF